MSNKKGMSTGETLAIVGAAALVLYMVKRKPPTTITPIYTGTIPSSQNPVNNAITQGGSILNNLFGNLFKPSSGSAISSSSTTASGSSNTAMDAGDPAYWYNMANTQV